MKAGLFQSSCRKQPRKQCWRPLLKMDENTSLINIGEHSQTHAVRYKKLPILKGSILMFMGFGIPTEWESFQKSHAVFVEKVPLLFETSNRVFRRKVPASASY